MSNQPISEQDIARMASFVQIKESVSLYNRVVELGFKECVHNFRNNMLTDKEKSCIQSTAGKYLKVAQRVQSRVQDVQHEQQQSQLNLQRQATPAAGAPLGANVATASK
eukprot:gb/GECG01010774.1/.p1 GENE.gb/GECG01010774.1/~~gb/GECG01010774.1/.p1  ORF type:complete len:109 (+),score=20.24 gb/GECG01010774.1/:1-327(+)